METKQEKTIPPIKEDGTRDFAEKIPATIKNRWKKIMEKYPRITRRIHIVESTGLSKPVVLRAMIDGMATEVTRTKLDEFFAKISELPKPVECHDAD